MTSPSPTPASRRPMSSGYRLPLVLTLALVIALSGTASAQGVTGLSGWSLYIDPGHSQQENMGVFGYSEAEAVLRVGLELRDILLEETDIAAVYMSRTTDAQQVGLSQRTDHANSVGASYFHSVHSNAAAPNVNHVFVLWPQLRDGSEPAPPYNGGRRMAQLMGPLLAQSMRIPASNNGAWGECDFYGASNCSTVSPKGSRNAVQRQSLMPSTLSEAGFHTNPTQNQRKMNAEWKRMEARAMFWSILDYHSLPRPAARAAQGIVTDSESGLALNGATVTIDGRTYTTDTFESLFNRFTNDPELLRNGFYYFEDLPAGPLDVTVEAEGYAPFTGQITPREDFFTFLDIGLLSTVPPVVTASQPVQGAEAFRITDPVVLTFSRPMDRGSVEAAFSISPEVAGTFAWADGDTRFTFRPAEPLTPQTDYTVTIAGSALGAAGQALDGNADGTGGDAFTLAFTSGFPDTEPPRLVASGPAPGASGVELHPVITVTFNERVDHATLDGRVTLVRTVGGAAVAGQVVPYDVGEQTVVSFFPTDPLEPLAAHRLTVGPGIRDLFLNEMPSAQQVNFTTGNTEWVVTSIDTFEQGFTQNWWAPQQSGSTAGIITDSTASSLSPVVVNLLTGSTASMRLDYGWDTEPGNRLIRKYLGGGAPRAVRFDSTYTLQAYVFGDGHGNRLRFAVRERTEVSLSGAIEASPWVTVDWLGWRLVSWNMSRDGVVAFTGDGVLDGQLLFDSVQLTYTPGRPAFGTYYVDDLRLVKEAPTTSDEPSAGAPAQFRVHPNYPNPFSDATTLRFELAEPAPVSVVVYNVLGAEVVRLAQEVPHAAGTHELSWDASGLAAGVYLVRIAAGDAVGTVRVALVR